jgi:hypothetical protein
LRMRVLSISPPTHAKKSACNGRHVHTIEGITSGQILEFYQLGEFIL